MNACIWAMRASESFVAGPMASVIRLSAAISLCRLPTAEVVEAAVPVAAAGA